MTGRPLWPAILVAWALTAIVLIAASFIDIQRLGFPDPDDAMRLMEVRDLIAGQSWWDVTQYRLASGQMHWSRLVDLPLAAVVLATRPLLGAAAAERAALVIVPLATLFAVLWLVADLTRRMLDDERARLAVLIAPLSVALLYQLRPLRIDHHGWQIVLAVLAVRLLVARPDMRTGAGMGLALAGLLTVSLEGLPLAVALCGIAALAWARDPARSAMLLSLVWTLFAAAALLQLATRGMHYAAPMCDAVTPQWIAVLGTAAVAVSLAVRTRRHGILVRLMSLALAAIGPAVALLVFAPECVAGPFGSLDPLTRRLWYEKVSEGLPVWEQFPSWAAMTIGLPVSGLVGAVLAWRASPQDGRERWTLLIGAQAAALLLAMLVMRAGATANALAVPGAAWLLASMLARARAIGPILPRTLATAAALFAVSPGLLAIAMLGFPETEARRQAQHRYQAEGRPACTDGIEARAVAVLPPAMLFAPLDISPDIVAMSRHRAVASGHHRNMAAMHDVIAAFTGDPATAHALIRRYQADYVVVCPGLNESELYRKEAPDGFWARLERGERFEWLEPVPLAGSPVLVWRVRR